MGRRIWAERQVMLFGGITKIVEHDPWLYPRSFVRWIKLQDVMQIFGAIHHYGDITTLSGETRATAARISFSFRPKDRQTV